MSLKDTFVSAWDYVPVDIASGGTASSPINLGGLRLFSIVVPSPWTAASLTFQASYDGGASWYDIWKNGSEYALTVSDGKDCNVDLQRFAPIQYLKIRSGTASAPVAQSAARTLGLVVRGI